MKHGSDDERQRVPPLFTLPASDAALLATFTITLSSFTSAIDANREYYLHPTIFHSIADIRLHKSGTLPSAKHLT